MPRGPWGSPVGLCVHQKRFCALTFQCVGFLDGSSSNPITVINIAFGHPPVSSATHDAHRVGRVFPPADEMLTADRTDGARELNTPPQDFDLLHQFLIWVHDYGPFRSRKVDLGSSIGTWSANVISRDRPFFFFCVNTPQRSRRSNERCTVLAGISSCLYHLGWKIIERLLLVRQALTTHTKTSGSRSRVGIAPYSTRHVDQAWQVKCPA